MHSAGRLSSHRSGALRITRGKYPAMWSSLPPKARAAILYILSHILESERPSYFSMSGLKSFGHLIVRRRREKAGKIVDRSRACGWGMSRRDDVEVVEGTIRRTEMGGVNGSR
jgi:acyl-CoA reductase-like NAD-dependent aldehyde dehydrogenase